MLRDEYFVLYYLFIEWIPCADFIGLIHYMQLRQQLVAKVSAATKKAQSKVWHAVNSGTGLTQ